MSKSWNAVFWLSAIRARRRGPWGPDWLPGKWSGGAEARSGFETEVERLAKGHKRVGRSNKGGGTSGWRSRRQSNGTSPAGTRWPVINGNMKIVCAWCNKKIGGKGTSLSHGICNKCLAQLKQPQFGFMQTLAVSPTRALGVRTRNRSRPVRAAGYQRPGSDF